jgi:hypothetical protein
MFCVSVRCVRRVKSPGGGGRIVPWYWRMGAWWVFYIELTFYWHYGLLIIWRQEGCELFRKDVSYFKLISQHFLVERLKKTKGVAGIVACIFTANLRLIFPRKWRQHVPKKRFPFTELHGVKSQRQWSSYFSLSRDTRLFLMLWGFCELYVNAQAT